MKKYILIIIIAFAFSCETEVYVAPEPLNKEIGIAPGEFELNVELITDDEINIAWTNAEDPDSEVTYEVVLFDSVVACDLTTNFHYLTNLLPNTEYLIKVNAIDDDFNKTTISKTIKTYDRLLQGTVKLDLGLAFEYKLEHIIQTNDNGFLISGVQTEPNSRQFYAKLDENYVLEWIKQSSLNIQNTTDVLQLNDDGYIITRQNSVTKIDNLGNELWKYSDPYSTNISSINHASILENNDIVLVGTTNYNRDEISTINLQGFVTLINSAGELRWQKYFGEEYQNRLKKVTQISNGNIVAFGTSTHTFSEVNIRDCHWMLELNESGKIVSDSIYINNFFGADIVEGVYELAGNNLVLTGSTYADFHNLGTTFNPRILRLNENRQVLTDIYPELTGLGYFPKLKGILALSSSECTFYSNSSSGVYITKADVNGQILWNIRLRDYPAALFLMDINENTIAYFTNDGHVLYINKNGYTGFEDW